jgi:hypothetical protein
MRLSRATRRAVLLLHLLASLSWIGVDLAIGVLSFTGLTTDDPRTMAIAYTALGYFAVPLLLVLGLATLATGATLASGTRFGLARYWWVVVKLAIGVVLTSLVVVALRPVLEGAAQQSAVVDASLPDRLAAARFDLIFPPLVSTTALVFSAWLGFYKPWGRLPWATRSDHAEQAQSVRAR